MGQGEVVLCDTDVIIEFYKENPEVLSSLKEIGQENIALSVVTAGELLYGALNKKELKQISNDIANLKVLHVDSIIGNRFIDLLEKYSLSHNLKIPDGLIAATALIENIPLYTLNLKDFKYIKGLRLFTPKIS